MTFAGLAALALTPVVAGVAGGYAAGGRLSALTGRLRGLWLLWLAAAVQAAQFHLGGDMALWRGPTSAVVFALVLVWLAVNLRRWTPPMRVAAGTVLLGALCNAAAIAANGRMPYSPQAARQAGLPGLATTPKNQPAGDGTRIGLLGDAVPIAAIHKVVSVGDLLIALGITVLVAAAMRHHAAPPSATRPTSAATGEGGEP